MADIGSKGLVKMDARAFALTLVMWGLALLLPVGTAFAQASHGLISGRVIDQQGASIPGATVTVTNQLTTAHQTTPTNDSGYFVFPEVLPGTYTLSVEKEGFEKLEQTGIVLIAADRLSAGTLQLKLGSTKAVVTVTAETTRVQTTSSEQSAVVTDSQMSALPSIGRDYMALMRTIPGSTYLGEGGASLGVSSAQVGFNGDPHPTAVNVNTNGVFSSVSNYSWDDAPTTMDNIQDVKVLTANYEPQYGKVSGAVINVTTKSGTTDFHGGVYYYLRNEDLNANDFFNNRLRLPRSRYRYNTFGGTVGGPIYLPRLPSLRNKLFFFLALDDEPSSVPAGPRTYLMPTASERLGDFTQSYVPGTTTHVTVLDPLTGQPFSPAYIVPTGRQNTLMQNVLKLFPLPNFTNTAISNGNYNYVINDSTSNPTNEESLRIDYAASSKWHIFGRWQRSYIGDTGRTPPGGIYAAWMNGTQSYDNRNVRFEFNFAYTFNPHTVNEFAIGHNMHYEYAVVPQSTLNQFTATTGGINFPQPYPANNPLNLIPAMSFTYGPSLSYSSRIPLYDLTSGYSYADNFTYIYKEHQLKLGFYVDSEHQDQFHHGGSGAIAGSFSFSDPNPSDPYNAGYSYAEALLGGFVSYANVTARLDDSVSANTFEWYAQDHWQATRRLSLNFGARFTYDRPQCINGSDGAVWRPSQYSASAAPPLFQPVLVNGTRMMKNPVNGQIYPAAYYNRFVPGAGNPAPGAIPVSSSSFPGIFNSRGVLVAPRFGFAYDVFGDGRTSIRGGIGMFYNQRTFAGAIYGNIINPPSQFYPTQYYGNVATFDATAGALSPTTMTYYDPNAKLPYTLQWTLGIQREVGFKSVLAVSYVANINRHNQYTKNINTVPYGAEFLPQNQDPTTGTPLADNYFRPFPGYGSLNFSAWGDNGNYNSLQVQLNRRMSHGLGVGVAYTWSKSLDDNWTTVYLPGKLQYGPTSVNMANRLVPNWVWDLPKASAHWNNLFSRGVLDNWQLSGIASFISGVPLTIGLSTTNSENITGGGDGARVIRTGNAVLPKSQRTFNQFFNTSVWALPAVNPIGAPRTVNYIGNGWTPEVYGPGMNNWDIAVTKKIPITKERVAGQLRCEMYNAWNHPSFSSVNTSANFNPATGAQSNTAFGQLTADRMPRIIQVALRISF